MSGTDAEFNNSPPESTRDWHRELMQARLRKIDDALDRLMSASYGHCVNCGVKIRDTEMALDPAIAFCPSCWKQQQNQSSQADFNLETLQPFDTILVGTRNSDYRILLLDPRTGRALVDGGQYLNEPRESILSGSSLHAGSRRQSGDEEACASFVGNVSSHDATVHSVVGKRDSDRGCADFFPGPEPWTDC